MLKLLFICTQNKLRSPTAEQIFSTYRNIETDSAGLGNDACVTLSTEQIMWADIIFVMEKTHKMKLTKNFRQYIKKQRIICLDIPDNYSFMQTELIERLKTKVEPFLKTKE